MPKVANLTQTYMAKFPDKVAKEFNKRWPAEGLSEDHALAFRNKIARELLDNEEEEVKARLTDEAKEAQRVASDKYKNAKRGSAPMDEEELEV